MNGKIIVSAVSLILVVGVAIGVVFAVQKNGSDPEVKAQQKSVMIICKNTNDPRYCSEVLSSAHVPNVADPKSYLTVLVNSTTEKVIKAFNLTDRLSSEHGGKDNGVKVGLDACKHMLELALDSLELSSNLVRDNNIQTINFQIPDFSNWLSSVISYKQTCLEAFDDDKEEEKKIKEKLDTESLENIKKITAIGLDIIADLTKILEEFNVKLELKPVSRRLLNVVDVEVDEEKIPTWFSHEERKLLGKGWRNRINKPNVVVAKDGSGQFKTIKDAIDSYPKGFTGRYIIYVKAGIYEEFITVPKTSVNLLIYGDGPQKTVVTGKRSFGAGIKTMLTATFSNEARGFIARSMKFENSAGPQNHQAVAFRNTGDGSAAVGCHFDGFQDTLYVHANRQFYRNCEISGTIDFIFGTSRTLIQNSKIIVRKPEVERGQFNTVTAEGTEISNMGTGIVIQNCQIVPDAALYPIRFQVKSFLGRPWKKCSTTVVMESVIGDFIHPEGWAPWMGTAFLDTLYYAEYANTGPGADVKGRINWKGYHGIISKAEAQKFTSQVILQAGPDSSTSWLRKVHVPNYLGFARP